MINGHTQLEQDWAAKFRPKKPTPYPAWLVRQLRREQTLQRSDTGEARQLEGIYASIQTLEAVGTTEIFETTRTGLSIEPLLESRLGGTIFVEVAGLSQDVGTFMVQRAGQIIDQFAGHSSRFQFGIAIHSLYSTSLETIRLVRQTCDERRLPLALRLGQHLDEEEALIVGDGPLYHLPALFNSDDRPHVPGLSALRFAKSEGLLDLAPRLIYGATLTEMDIPTLVASKATVVYCPRSTDILEGGVFPLAQLLSANVPVELGSDSLAVVPSLDIRDDQQFVLERHQIDPSTFRR